jgi:hypothetical protein
MINLRASMGTSISRKIAARRFFVIYRSRI